MFFAILTLLTALSIAGIAAWFSIVGLMSIFSAEALSIAIMAALLELGKLVSASWLYRNWRTGGWMLKTYLSIAVLVLMMVTSMGIFGYLSRAHLAHMSVGQEVTLQIQRIDAKISREQAKIHDAENVIAQLDNAVKVLQDNARIRGPDGAITVRRSQQEERAQLNQEITQASGVIESLQDQRLILDQKNITVEQELGPLKYVAELVYDDQSQENLDRTVRIFILMLVFVFDPLAIMLLIAANQTLLQHGVVLERSGPDAKTQPEPEPESEPESEPEPAAETPDETCYKCGATLLHAPGIGPFCAEPHCDVLDAPLAPKPEPGPDPEPASESENNQDLPERLSPEVNTGEQVTDIVEPEVRKMVEELVQEEQPDISQLQQAARHLANSKANKNNMTEEEIVEVLASTTKSDARTKLGFWAVPLPNRDANKE